jgi:hypothetical protein
MIRKLLLIIVILDISFTIVRSQTIVPTSELFKRTDENSRMGRLNIEQDPALDTLISRYILGYKNMEEKNGGFSGMEGWRIQIYFSSNRNAKEESSKVILEFLSRFPASEYPDLKPYIQFAQPAYYKIRVGDFRTKTEATRLFLLISKVFPDAYIVPDIINFPGLNNK